MAETKIKAGQFSGIVGHGTDGYFLMTNGDGTMAWAEGGATGPSVTSVSYPGDDLAADPTGGQTVVLTGTGFAASGMTVSIGGTTAPSVAHDSNTRLTITTPAKAAGDYDIVVTNTVTGASGTFVNGISYNGIPTWTTATGSLGTFESETTISTITLQATEPDGGTITFNITNGALPTGLSLTGANIDGTTTAESSTTLYSFTIEAIDDENQSTPRNFSITVNSAAIISSENFTINTYTGNGSTQSIEGKIGTAAAFNGTTSQIRTVGNPIPSTSSLFSISFWFQLDNTNTNNHIFSIFDNVAGTNKLLIRSLTGGDFQVGVYGTSGSNFITTTSSTFSYTTGVWYHLVYISTNTGDNEFWIDGVQKATSSGVAANTTSSTIPITMGGRGDFGGSSTERFGGQLDQVRIFDKALSSGEVTTLYGENNASSTKSTTDIFDDGSGIALYEFEEGAKDTGGTNGYIGAAGVFDGSSSYIETPSLIPVNNYSFSCWVYFDSLAAASNYRLIYEAYKNTWWYLAIFDGGKIATYNGTSTFNTTSNVISAGQWYHIVYTSSSTGGKNIYLNGNSTPVATNGDTTGNSNPSGSWEGFGKYHSAGVGLMHGKIDQTRIFNKVLTTSEIATLYGETSASATKSTTDIFDDGSAVALYELEGNALDTGRGAIDSGQSAVFNGSSGYIQSTSLGSQFAGNNTLSVSLWFKSTTDSHQSLFNFSDTGDASTEMGLRIRGDVTGDQIGIFNRNGGTYNIEANNTGTGSVIDGDWHHVVLTGDSNGNKLYFDGSELTGIVYQTGSSSTTLSVPSDINSFSIGTNIDSGGAEGFLNGEIDQVRIYSSALSSGDVTNLFNETNVPTTNLVAHYKLDGNANDSVGSYNGTATSITYSDPAEYPKYDGTATNVSYGYDGTPTNVSFVGTSFQPDLVWIKDRVGTDNHHLFDSIRGINERLMSNQTSAENTEIDCLNSFDSNGFSIGANGGVNANGENHVAWCWKAADTTTTISAGTVGNTIASDVRANQDAGFSIVSFTAPSTEQNFTVGHGLSQKPDMVILKSRDGGAWFVWHKDLSQESYYLYLQDSFSESDLTQDTRIWGQQSFTDSVISMRSNYTVLLNHDCIAYCFHSVDGYQKVGSYNGDSSVAITVTTGFKPRFLMLKLAVGTSSAYTGWVMFDYTRDIDSDQDNPLYANASYQEGLRGNGTGSADDAVKVQFTDTGFIVDPDLNRDGETNAGNGTTYIYLAIA